MDYIVVHRKDACYLRCCTGPQLIILEYNSAIDAELLAIVSEPLDCSIPLSSAVDKLSELSVSLSLEAHVLISCIENAQYLELGQARYRFEHVLVYFDNGRGLSFASERLVACLPHD